jgi:hypothetical protein
MEKPQRQPLHQLQTSIKMLKQIVYWTHLNAIMMTLTLKLLKMTIYHYLHSKYWINIKNQVLLNNFDYSKGADTKRELEFIKDLRHRISLGGESKALPSICCYTWHNSNNK